MPKAPTDFSVGLPSGKVNLAVQRPTVNLREAETLGAQAAEVGNRAKAMPAMPTFSKHGTFGPRKITHPGIETED
jgi:hypothetical protein